MERIEKGKGDGERRIIITVTTQRKVGWFVFETG